MFSTKPISNVTSFALYPEIEFLYVHEPNGLDYQLTNFVFS